MDFAKLDDLGIKGDDCVVGNCHWLGKGEVLPSISGDSNTVASVINLHVMQRGVLAGFVAALVVNKRVVVVVDGYVERRFLWMKCVERWK